MLFFKTDFEKAYDKVEWPFILAMLKALGFRSLFLNSLLEGNDMLIHQHMQI